MKGLVRSFSFAFRGIEEAVRRERNFRIHIAAVFFTLYFALLYGLTRAEYAILALTFIVVPAFELVNTAIEHVVDAKVKAFDEHARLAKDISAASVLVATVGAIGVALSLFSDMEKLAAAFGRVLSLPHCVILIAAAAAALWFVFGFGEKKNQPVYTADSEREKRK